METTSALAHASLERGRVERALDLIRREVASGFLPAASVAVYHRGERIAAFCAGHCDPETRRHPLDDGSPFLVASLTKPVVCAAALLLLEEGLFGLDEPASLHVPEIANRGKEAILIRHLFTHTSGLPDQLPQSKELRRRQATRAEFVRAVCDCEPLFPAGTGIRYQSMGILILAEIAERLTGTPIADLLAKRLFAPLGMDRSSLGMPAGGLGGAVLTMPPSFDPASTDVGDDWNTEYWRSFGAPWGGMHSTAEDLGRFLLHLAGARPGPLSPAARGAMTRSQTDAMLDIPEAQRAAHSFGLGLMIRSQHFGAFTSRLTFGHVGATGTLCWLDPATSLAVVLLTNQPRALRDHAGPARDLFARFSNAVAASLRTLAPMV